MQSTVSALTVSFLVHAWLYALAATHCSWQRTLFAEPSSLRRQHVYVGIFQFSHRIQRSDDYDKRKPQRHCWYGVLLCYRHIRRLSPQCGSEFRIHVSVVFKNVGLFCKLHSNVIIVCRWRQHILVNSSPVNLPEIWAEPGNNCNRNDFNCYEFY